MDLLSRQMNWLHTALKSAKPVSGLDQKAKPVRSVDAIHDCKNKMHKF
jgi:hypothetical protein